MSVMTGFNIKQHSYHLLCFIALAILLITNPALAQTTGNTAVTGQVTNGTPGGTLPTDAPVTLQFFEEGEWTHIYTTTLAVDGTFRFDGIDSESGNDFLTQITYQDIDYYSEPATVITGTEVTADILIFESTDDMTTVQVDQVHYFIVPAEKQVHIAEYYLIGNTGDRTYIGRADPTSGAHTTLHFTTPPGAERLNFEGSGLEERFVGDETRFADTRAILPGTATIEVDFSYTLPYSEGVEIARAVNVPVKSVVMIVNSESVGLKGAKLSFNGVMNTQMGVAASYTAGSLDAGEALTFAFVAQTETVAGQMAPSTATRARQQRNPGREVGIGVIVLALVGLASYRLWSHVPPVPERARPLLVEIAKLDAAFRNGALAEDEYRQKREVLKNTLRAQLQKTETETSVD